MYIKMMRKLLFWQICSRWLNRMWAVAILVFQAETSFSEEEEEKLQIAFSLEKQDLHLVLEAISFILEQVRCFYRYELINAFLLSDCRCKNTDVKIENTLWEHVCSILHILWGHVFPFVYFTYLYRTHCTYGVIFSAKINTGNGNQLCVTVRKCC